MGTKDDDAFRALCDEAERNPSIIGMFLGGSRGKGRPTPHSDYDVYVVVKDGLAAEVEASLRGESSPFHEFSKGNDVIVLDAAGLKIYPPWGHGDDMAYDYLRLKALIDKSGIVQGILDEKAKMHLNADILNAKIDAYVNFFYRSLKCVRDGYLLGARLEANISMGILIDLLFAFHDRPSPYGKYLEWELEAFPLEKLPIQISDLLINVKKVWDSADVDAQRYLFGVVERMSRDAGLHAQIDSWGEEPLRFMRDFEFGL
ncbi:MAG: hypothetical protein JW839_02915 [Candidatus Lokiarchaeota archaeon]|nr:hypothetical protein [Candidatus Lokiarchaeota archaeon]